MDMVAWVEIDSREYDLRLGEPVKASPGMMIISCEDALYFTERGGPCADTLPLFYHYRVLPWIFWALKLEKYLIM